MKQTLCHPSWDHLQRGSLILARKFLSDWNHHVIHDSAWAAVDPLIIGVSRGGVFPALIMSHVLDLPMKCVNYSSKSGAGDDKNHDNVIPEMDHPFLLIVDDITDSGGTLAELSDAYLSRGHDVWTAALYYKPNDLHEPNFFWRQEDSDSPWIEFPWEV